jgi:hypothetical protein
MTTDPFSRAVHDNVCAMLNGTDEITWQLHPSGVALTETRTGALTAHAKCIVDDQRDFVRVCNLDTTSIYIWVCINTDRIP